ncbi:MAG: ribbon-helix-helix domain-containing protein [bacterium]|nr:ribbon-helix-helix domain-containing protein [bacterium]
MPSKTASKTDIISFSLPRQLAQELDREARAQSMTRSEFVRDSLRRKLAFKGLRELQREAAKRAKQAGILTEEDVVRAVREIRNSH